MTILTGFGNEETFVDALLSRFQPRYENTREFALQRRVVLLKDDQDIHLDVSLGALDFEHRCVARASPYQIGAEQALITCSAEDLIVLKAFANRGIDWLDVERVIQRQGRNLRVEQIWSELRPLIELKEEPEIGDHLKRLFDKSPR